MNKFPGGVWPVMITPFTKEGQVDYPALKKLVDWYIEAGVKGLFAVCQTSEMFFLNLEERIKIAAFVKEAAAGRVPVIASGHTADEPENQISELKQIAATGVDAVILLTNRMAAEDEPDSLWIERTQKILDAIPEDVKLGLYECPYPYKRVMSEEVTRFCAESGRFYFLKDTSCDLENIRMKLRVCEGSNLKVYNANTTTLLESLRMGVYGYSGVMANFHPKLYVYLCEHFKEEHSQELEDFLTISSLIERQCYPVNAKYYLQKFEKLPMTTVTRTKPDSLLTDTFKMEVGMLAELTKKYEEAYQI